MTVNVIFPNILDVLYKQFHFSMKRTQNSGRYWAQVTCYLIVSVISVEACFVYRFLLLIWSPTLEKRVKLLENLGFCHILTVMKLAFVDVFFDLSLLVHMKTEIMVLKYHNK